MSKLTWRTSTLAALITSFSFSTTVAAEGVSISDEVRNYVKDSYIFVFKDTVNQRDVVPRAKALVRGQGGKLGSTYSNTIRGFSAKMPAHAAARLAANNPQIAYYEKDGIALAVGKPDKPGKPPKGDDGGDPPPSSQQTPWGIDRVGGAADGTGKTACVIDSGVDLDHPDLNVNVSASRNFVTYGKNSPDDKNGHGTHVAGTIAAIDNNIGVVGVAAGAEAVALRALDNSGSGAYSWIIAAVDYTKSSGVCDVVNMSLGGPRYNISGDEIGKPLNDAVKAAASGIPFAIAAGNSNDNASLYSPASANGDNVYTVSAIDANDNFASFSNYGNPPVDCAAPGVNILSTAKGGGYVGGWSGTSMAAPHVAGVLLLGGGISTELASLTGSDGKTYDKDGVEDPICKHSVPAP